MDQEVSQTTNFSLKTFIRLVIFSLFIYFAISYFSRYTKSPEINNDPTVLGEEAENSSDVNIKPFFDQAYQLLPPDSRQKLENIMLGLNLKVEKSLE